VKVVKVESGKSGFFICFVRENGMQMRSRQTHKRSSLPSPEAEKAVSWSKFWDFGVKNGLLLASSEHSETLLIAVIIFKVASL
jgi:hypothetical protein